MMEYRARPIGQSRRADFLTSTNHPTPIPPQVVKFKFLLMHDLYIQMLLKRRELHVPLAGRPTNVLRKADEAGSSLHS